MSRRRLVVCGVLAWLCVTAAGVFWLVRLSHRKVDFLAVLLSEVPPAALNRDVLDGWETHEAMVYAFTRRSPVPLEDLRKTLMDASWIVGDAHEAIVKNMRPSYPGFCDPGTLMGAPLYMHTGATGIELWAFGNGTIIARKRIGATRPSVLGPTVR